MMLSSAFYVLMIMIARFFSDPIELDQNHLKPLRLHPGLFLCKISPKGEDQKKPQNVFFIVWKNELHYFDMSFTRINTHFCRENKRLHLQ